MYTRESQSTVCCRWLHMSDLAVPSLRASGVAVVVNGACHDAALNLPRGRDVNSRRGDIPYLGRTLLPELPHRITVNAGLSVAIVSPAYRRGKSASALPANMGYPYRRDGSAVGRKTESAGNMATRTTQAGLANGLWISIWRHSYRFCHVSAIYGGGSGKMHTTDT